MGSDDVKRSSRPVAVRRNVFLDFQDQILVLDAAIWLYLLAYGYRAQLAAGDLLIVVNAFWRRVQRFISAGVLLIVVLDGAQLPGKAAEHERRRQRKIKAVAKALGLGDADELLKANLHISRAPESHCGAFDRPRCWYYTRVRGWLHAVR